MAKAMLLFGRGDGPAPSAATPEGAAQEYFINRKIAGTSPASPDRTVGARPAGAVRGRAQAAGSFISVLGGSTLPENGPDSPSGRSSKAGWEGLRFLEPGPSPCSRSSPSRWGSSPGPAARARRRECYDFATGDKAFLPVAASSRTSAMSQARRRRRSLARSGTPDHRSR